MMMMVMASSNCSSSMLRPSSKRHHSFFVVCCNPTLPSTCFNGPTVSDSSSSLSARSYSSRWFNPLRRRNFDQPPPIERHWVEADDQPLTSPERFTVASYNILGDRNASYHRDLYARVPSHYLKWDRRKRVICKELFGWEPDIICLQEVDKYLEISNILVKAGYTGSYKRRTGDSIDGCAMFWKADNLSLSDSDY